MKIPSTNNHMLNNVSRIEKRIKVIISKIEYYKKLLQNTRLELRNANKKNLSYTRELRSYY
jgi:hypothetical protein